MPIPMFGKKSEKPVMPAADAMKADEMNQHFTPYTEENTFAAKKKKKKSKKAHK